jgi:hypothetical protein
MWIDSYEVVDPNCLKHLPIKIVMGPVITGKIGVILQWIQNSQT